MITVISLGGSLVYPKKFDKNFVKKFSNLISNEVKKGNKFVILCGGGYLARKLQRIFSFIKNKYLLDWIGILATRSNAKRLKENLKLNVYKKIITNPTKKLDFKEDVIVAAGWKPGWSTDYDAVLLAKNLGIKSIINMSNIDYAYTKDPKKFKDAKKIEQTTWKEFRKIVGDEWKPGLSMPFDPIASREAQKLNMEVVITGNDLNNLKNILENKKFKGTIITCFETNRFLSP